jgi:signal transduction histidine kinase
MRRPRISLRARVVLAIILVALAPHALVFAWTQIDRPVPGRMWTNVRDGLEEARRSPVDLEALAKRRGVRLRVIRVVDGAITVDADADDPTEPMDRLEAFFLRPSGAPTLRQVDDAMPPMLSREEVRWARASGTSIGCQFVDLLYCQAIGVGRDADGEIVVIHLQQSSYRAVGAVYQLRSQLVRIGLLVWPIAILLAWITGTRIVRPLERLRRQALDRSRKAAPKLEQTRDEVGDLAAALNALIGALEAERRGHEEFVADLVHELKSTAASVRASADALDDEKADERTRRLARVLRESSAKLQATVARFLDLARAEAGFPREEREPVDLSELAKNLVSRMCDDARFEDVAFEAEGGKGTIVSGVADRLEAMLRELLENGASFAPRGGRVKATVRQEDDEIVLVVEDDGPGIAEAEREDVFRRYYTTRGQARGTGLGLALVRAVAEAHGGRAELLARTKGAAFAVHLPRFTPHSHEA